jgi:hypothetical protein
VSVVRPDARLRRWSEDLEGDADVDAIEAASERAGGAAAGRIAVDTSGAEGAGR